MRKFGLIGFPLTHSFSESYFQEKFFKEDINGCQYQNHPIQDLKTLRLLLEKENLSGFNVTIPYKENIIQFLDELSTEATAIGAVNTVVKKDEKWIGHNTDWIGFYESITPLLQKHHRKALVLGSGGASKAIVYALKKLKIEHLIISRKEGNTNYAEITNDLLADHLIIVNCTPLGTYPKTDEYPPIPYELLSKKHLLYDLIYNPSESRFLTYGKANETNIKNGLEMLQRQAEAAWSIWNS
ncbi:MAG: shikimate dehydrogenase [Flavobacteriales bacterium]|mgnify:FL=1|nr:shikimate dehydrogenase [Flavobacteriales bacterium]|tara:strand:- start:247 stop:969 length:723 start_codon:yes stop_codon:yes gene_type:complete